MIIQNRKGNTSILVELERRAVTIIEESSISLYVCIFL